ncbi:DeoR/GlpR family DNA-binding transcription regulator [Methylocapsa sp. S129]|uniref:DeoR/GlpR family DNA-binding transcription regulator n=1 Tax=Methylocapsa sp. S129 TaxID=1641869 RepID=UPI00131BDCD5|nr:DeoR/GlpR family DNA-binding transcription regulator [Methylocapsa sp. S129]
MTKNDAIAAGSNPSSQGRMLAAVRHARIMAAFERNGFISVTDMAQEIGVSAMTIRRDLVVLAQMGLLTRTHGGAVAPSENDPSSFDADEPVFEQRLRQNTDAKIAIARAAAELVGPRESIGLDVGTSIITLVDELVARDDLILFTNSMHAAMRLAEARSPVYILGGEVRIPEFSVVGANATNYLKNHFLDRAFIGVSGINAAGLYDYSPEDTEVKRAFIESADCVVVLCDASKFGRRALSRIASLDAVDILVTDQPPPADLAEALSAAAVRVIVAAT